MQPADRPPHLIASDEVAEWLADSVNGRITYHNATLVSANSILRSGARIERSQIGTVGQGFYTATEPEPFYGPAWLREAIRIRNPLIGHLDEIEEYVDRLIGLMTSG
jgi:hypothetical protein